MYLALQILGLALQITNEFNEPQGEFWPHFCNLSLYCKTSPTPSIASVVGLSEIVGWATSCHIIAQRFSEGELGPVQLQLTLDRLVHKLKLLC